MAITNTREQKICDKYGLRDETGHVHCNECPLVKGNPENYDFRCKANSHYDRHTGEWEYDADYKTDYIPAEVIDGKERLMR